MKKARKKKHDAVKSVDFSSLFKTVYELFPRRFPGHRLNTENTLGGCPPAKLVVVEKGQFFNKTGWLMLYGWKLRGWATPPYKRGDAVAIVYEKTEPVKPDGLYHERLEPGIYWVHGSNAALYYVH